LADPATLDLTFGALADATRRAIVGRLSQNDELPVSALAEPFAMSLPAILKHLGVLERAGLIIRTKVGRSVRCRMAPDALRDARDWLSRQERFWNDRLDALAAFVEAPSPRPGNPAAKDPS
jgi:DNA-binding transcriptional ArsR family regulator